MKILGIESSCDETAAAVVEDGVRLLSNVVSSQMDDFARYGGVIPEVAARSHIEAILPVVHKALEEASCTMDDIDGIGVTYAPGLIGSLLIGSLTARTLAVVYDKPLYAVHHVEGHVYANFITEIREGRRKKEEGREAQKSQAALAEPSVISFEGDVGGEADQPNATGAQPRRVAPEKDVTEGSGLKKQQSLLLPQHQPQFPLLALIVSGGHTQLALFHDHGDYVLLGQAQDDAVGEAFDKVAKIIGLPYPGGPSIAKAAEQGDAKAFDLPQAKLPCPIGCTHELNAVVTQDDIDNGRAIRGGRGEYFLRYRCHKYDFSFSGLKTAVLRAVQHECGVDHTFPSSQLPERVSESLQRDMAASFQCVAIETLIEKTVQACRDHSPASVVIAGGVAANQELRRQLKDALPIPIEYAPMNLCTDNAAMIASLAYFMAQAGRRADPLTLDVIPSLSMTKTRWVKEEG